MKKGFTLVELLVVIAVIGILSAIITPNLLNARNSARIAAGQKFDSSVYHSIGDYLVGEWMFDVPNSALIDTSGFIKNCSTSSIDTSPTYTATGGYNGKGAYYFDGTDDYFSTTLDFSPTAFTLSAWINTSFPSSADGARCIFEKRNVLNEWRLCTNNDRKLYFLGFYDQTTAFSFTSSLSMPADKWNFVSVVIEGIKVTFYINGSLTGSQNASQNIWDTSSIIRIGTDGLDVDRYFSGYIDDARIYATALSSSDIQKLYAEGAEAYSITLK